MKERSGRNISVHNPLDGTINEQAMVTTANIEYYFLMQMLRCIQLSRSLCLCT